MMFYGIVQQILCSFLIFVFTFRICNFVYDEIGLITKVQRLDYSLP